MKANQKMDSVKCKQYIFGSKRFCIHNLIKMLGIGRLNKGKTLSEWNSLNLVMSTVLVEGTIKYLISSSFAYLTPRIFTSTSTKPSRQTIFYQENKRLFYSYKR